MFKTAIAAGLVAAASADISKTACYLKEGWTLAWDVRNLTTSEPRVSGDLTYSFCEYAIDETFAYITEPNKTTTALTDSIYPTTSVPLWNYDEDGKETTVAGVAVTYETETKCEGNNVY